MWTTNLSAASAIEISFIADLYAEENYLSMQRIVLTNYLWKRTVTFVGYHGWKETQTMLELKSAAQLGKAIERAKAGRLFVRFVQFRQFRVENRANGRTYNVNFF